MKITNDELKKIIKEETMKVLKIGMGPPIMAHGKPQDQGIENPHHNHGEQEHGDYDYRGRMTKSNLYNIAKHAQMLHDMLSDDDDIEPWVQEKIAVATEGIETVAEYMEYEKKVRGGHE
jgi:hypothetical protein